MTSPLPVKVPTRGEAFAALFDLLTATIKLLEVAQEGDYHDGLFSNIAREKIINASVFLGLRLSADEPAAQHPSDLVKRLRSISLPPSMAVVQSWITEAAAHIEALEAAAAQPSEREKALYDIRWTRDDGELLRCNGLTARTVFSRLMGAIANSGAITVHSIEPAAYDTPRQRKP